MPCNRAYAEAWEQPVGPFLVLLLRQFGGDRDQLVGRDRPLVTAELQGRPVQGELVVGRRRRRREFVDETGVFPVQY